jgi:Ni,Fe-hydrogenase I small subunit
MLQHTALPGRVAPQVGVRRVANVLWLQAACCGGESASLLNAAEPDFAQALRLADARFLWHPQLTGDAAPPLEETLARCAAGEVPVDVLVVEGAVGRTAHARQAHRSLARPAAEWILEIAPRSRWVVAAGTCASFGGVMVHGRNRPGMSGLQFQRDRPGGLLGAEFRSGEGLPVVNVAGCPAHPDWMTGTLLALLERRLRAADLDRYQRYRVYYARLAHHGCPRNEYYEFKSSAEEFSQQGCLFENLGCRGTLCESDCNERLWLGRSGSCPRGGFPCLSCTSPLFPDAFSPFFETQKIGGIPTSLPLDVPKAWYVGISGLSKLACPERLRRTAVSATRVGAGPADEDHDGGSHEADV